MYFKCFFAFQSRERGPPKRSVSNSEISSQQPRRSTLFQKKEGTGQIPRDLHVQWGLDIYSKICRLTQARFLEDDGRIDKALWKKNILYNKLYNFYNLYKFLQIV